MSEVILLKKKPVSKGKLSNINIIINNKDRDLKQLFKNTKAKSKYQKYVHKNEKSKKLAYPTISDIKSTRNTVLNQASHDRRLYEILTGVNAASYANASVSKSKSGNRKTSRSNTSRKTTEVPAKKSFTRLEKMTLDKPFLSQHHGRHFQSFHNGAMKFKKHTPKGNVNEKLYTIKTKDKDIHSILNDGSQERKKYDSVTSVNNKNLIINLNNQCTFPIDYQSF